MLEGDVLMRLWQVGGLPLVLLLLVAAWCAGLIAREATALALGLPRPPDQLIVLGALAAVAPLIGLLGTVMGLVRVFTDDTAPGAVADGIAQALFTTQVGLVVAVPALLARQGLLRWRERQVARRLEVLP